MEQPNLPQSQPGANPAAVLPTSGLALASLIAGILGFTAFPVVGMLVALITGYMARQETRAIPPTASGDGLATAGIVMGWIQAGLILVAFCCVAAFLVFGLGIAGINLRSH